MADDGKQQHVSRGGLCGCRLTAPSISAAAVRDGTPPSAGFQSRASDANLPPCKQPLFYQAEFLTDEGKKWRTK
ncbi:hypothetical protein GEV33_013112 [Tenebrio molitor]|uniref:Uncharacterized protein n=1 Tax=Tenebrio molitor TaxID=7067 RepID=A0A8J6L2X8_TENMO|nr:hypothetical protein GEV33_013112 [Tenebrio molitor]